MPLPRRLLASLLLPTLAACQTFVETIPTDEADPADQVEVLPPSHDDKGDQPGWASQPSLHLGESRYGAVDPGGRHIYSMWVAGSAARPVALDLAVVGQDDAAVRLAVLGPLVGGQRAVLGSDGYGAAVGTAAVTVEIAEAAQILVVVGSHRLASFAAYEIDARCADEACGPETVDALVAPKVGGLIGQRLADGSALVQTRLNQALAQRDKFEVELWRSPPGVRWHAELVAVSESSGDQANFLLPPGAIAEGDDLMVVVRAGDGLPTADRGTWARFAPEPRLFARLDMLLYSDLGAVTVSGVTGYFEGHDEIALRRAASGRQLVSATAEATLPGAPGNGFGAFEVTLAPEIWRPDGSINPDLPRNGEVLSVGRIDGNGGYAAFGCFEFCNDLAGLGDCTSRPRPCP
jgi:hypothetical protein